MSFDIFLLVFFPRKVLICVPDESLEIKVEPFSGVRVSGRELWSVVLAFVAVKYRLEKDHKMRALPLY